jgi:pimeloyl-ACP methyl ester carboxylesterase
MPIFRIEKKGMSYWASGKDLSEKRDTVLFIHGAGGGQLTWSFQKAFFEKEFNPIIIELPGHGESGGEGEEEIEKYAGHVFSFLAALGIRKVFLIGHSMGGAIVQTLALTSPEAIRGIVLAGTGAKLRVFPAVLNGVRTHFEKTVKEIVQYAFSRKTSLELIERGIEQLLQCRPEVLYGDFLACDRFDIIDEVARIDLPTLILCGNEDELTPVKYSEFLHSRIRGSKLEVIPDAGHMVMLEAPEMFNHKVREFVVETLKGQRSPG